MSTSLQDGKPRPHEARPLPTLHDMTMFRLYRAWSAANPIFTRLCEGRFGITRREWRILAIVSQHETLTSTQAAHAAALDAARTSRTIGTLCEKGLLTRSREAADGRTVRIALSEKGRERYNEIMPVIASLNELVFQDLDETEICAFNNMLNRVVLRATRMLEEDLVKERLHRGHPGKR